LSIWVAWNPLIDSKQDPLASPKSVQVIHFIGRLLFGVLLCTGVLLFEKFSIQGIAGNFHERLYAEHIADQKFAVDTLPYTQADHQTSPQRFPLRGYHHNHCTWQCCVGNCWQFRLAAELSSSDGPDSARVCAQDKAHSSSPVVYSSPFVNQAGTTWSSRTFLAFSLPERWPMPLSRYSIEMVTVTFRSKKPNKLAQSSIGSSCQSSILCVTLMSRCPTMYYLLSSFKNIRRSPKMSETFTFDVDYSAR